MNCKAAARPGTEAVPGVHTCDRHAGQAGGDEQEGQSRDSHDCPPRLSPYLDDCPSRRSHRAPQSQLSGCAYVVGFTLSRDFALKNPLQAARQGLRDAVLVKLAPSGSEYLYSTFVGGSNQDYGLNVPAYRFALTASRAFKKAVSLAAPSSWDSLPLSIAAERSWTTLAMVTFSQSANWASACS